MERVNKICCHPLWRESVEQIRALEAERVFCRHDIPHFLDVARLAWIEGLERGMDVEKEEVYAAALLHDIGRHLQYTQGIPHEEGSARLARDILADCGFSQEERERILAAILGHRAGETGRADGLAGLIYRADKASRACLFCSACQECNWSAEKKNLTLRG